ncbi:unnamed protein product [Pseudo-nitzschia multistriata]|uniref:Uncharacterized protein n=1 Tax=Pseudo-nitzschia multistriata TaxID=183589 RepID=A0A448ZET7_9STRA|nr:unnamed protein product [Pseudo-nitzschia multistriata]
MSSSYITIRDDTGIRSLSVNERDFLRSCALKNADPGEEDDNDYEHSNRDNSNKMLRCDGRRGNDVRNVRMQLGRWDNGAECTVQWGAGTRVTSLCSAELVPPSPDRPNEGIMNFTVDISPMASSSFKLAPAISTGPSGGSMSVRGSNHSDQYQRLLSNRILRCIERIVLIGGALDTEALVLQAGKWVWKFTVALTVLDAGGNILDACVLATMAALKHYRKPQVDISEDDESEGYEPSNVASLPTMIPSIVKEATPLPLHHTPLSISFGLIPADDAVNSTSSTSVVAALIDPTDREELVQSGSLTIAMNVHSEICLLDYGGGCELTPNKLRGCWKVAETAVKNLCQLLETALTKADEQAQEERLQRLQINQNGGIPSLPPLPPADRNIPFLQETENEDDMEVDAEVDEAQVQHIDTEAEEAYRKNALDYSSGHAPVSVREDGDAVRGAGQKFGNQAGSLLAAMLKSVGQASDATANKVGGDNTGNGPSQKDTDGMAEASEGLKKEEKTITTTENSELAAPLNKKVSASKTRTSAGMDLDDDEEEQPVTLTSEFGSVTKTVGSEAKRTEEIKTPTLETDIDDLSMAIKSKKKKKKSKKK